MTNEHIKSSLDQAREILSANVVNTLKRTRDVARIARAITIIGCIDRNYTDSILTLQHDDGGWIDTEDTAWALAYLQSIIPDDQRIESAKRWLEDNELTTGGWGRSLRDQLRIPITSIILHFCDFERKHKEAFFALQDTWVGDFKMDIKLTYKGAFYLLGSHGFEPNDALIKETIDFLVENQNYDGGFGPWKGHPLGSDPWSTGVCLASLCTFSDKTGSEVLDRAANWLLDKQLDSGYWRCHFIDEGSSYAFWGLKKYYDDVLGLAE